MTSLDTQLGPILVDFSKYGTFPADDIVSAACAQKSTFSAAIAALSAAKSDLEEEVRNISQGFTPDVNDWIEHAKAIQGDIKTLRKLAHSIVQYAEEDEQLLEGLKEKEACSSFLAKELSFNQELLSILRNIHQVYRQLVGVERLVTERQFTDALTSLNDTYKLYLNTLRIGPIQAMRILELKYSDLRESIHKELLKLWENFVQVDSKHQTITIHQVISSLDSFQDVKKISKDFWNDLDNLIVKPRTLIKNEALQSIVIKDCCVSLGPVVDHSIQSLFAEIEGLAGFLGQALPGDIIRSLSEIMMPSLSERIIQGWLDRAIPSNPDQVFEYEKTLTLVSDFVANMESIQWRVDGLRNWIENPSRIWLNKRRETMLDWTRTQISMGLGASKMVERIETRLIQGNEDFPIDIESKMDTHEWDAAWDGDDEITIEDTVNRTKDPNDQQGKNESLKVFDSNQNSSGDDDLEDDVVDAWGWGDEDAEDTDLEKVEPGKTIAISGARSVSPSIAEKPTLDDEAVSFTENYRISSLPQSILKAVIDTYEEYETLSSLHNKKNPVAAAAPGLLSLPIQILAMYRATSPDCYESNPVGNMYRFNDSLWLAKMLKDFKKDWNHRTDIQERLSGMNKLESDISILESFGKRAYRNELNEQRITVNELLGGTQNFFRWEDVTKDKLKNNILAVIRHIRELSGLWENVLPYSAWASATGSLVNTVAIKLIIDVLDLPDIGVDEAKRIATIMSEVESLDILFIRKTDSTDLSEVPLTAQFADSWMKMKFLNEVLQSNLKDVRFLWFESDLSLYFTANEIVELIRLSFEMNSGAKQVIKEITDNPNPKEDEALTESVPNRS